MSYSDYGFVIRCVELADTGRVFYRGRKGAYTREKDAIPLSQTFRGETRNRQPAEDVS